MLDGMEGFLYIAVLLLGLCYGAEKKWTRDHNFENPKNWEGGRAPCGNDVVIIPENSPPVFIQTASSIKEMVLPRNGEVILGAAVEMAFREIPKPTPNCPESGRNIKFATTNEVPSWLDPENWCDANRGEAECLKVPLLDSQKVPGVYDKVVFPDGHYFTTDLGLKFNVTVRGLAIWNQTYTSLAFENFRKTEDGKKLFPTAKNARGGAVTIRSQSCTDVSGCATGNDVKKVMYEICRFQRRRCPTPLCESAVLPEGHCCRICGSVMSLSYRSGFNLGNLINSLKTDVLSKRENFSEVSFIPAKMSSGSVQLVLTDDDGEVSKEAASMIEARLQSDINQQGIMYSVTGVTSRQSGIPRAPGSHRQTGSDAMSTGDIVGVVFGLGAALSIILLIATLVYRRQPSIFSGVVEMKSRLAVRFSTLRSRLRSHLEFQNSNDFSSQVVETVGGGHQAFANPTFGYAGYLHDRMFEMSPATNGEQQPDGGSFSNPLYDTQMESVFDDPTKVTEEEKSEDKGSNKTNGV